MAIPGGKSTGSEGWVGDPKQIERARIVLAVSLAKRSPGELVRIILDWLDDQASMPFPKPILPPRSWSGYPAGRDKNGARKILLTCGSASLDPPYGECSYAVSSIFPLPSFIFYLSPARRRAAISISTLDRFLNGRVLAY